MSYISVIEQIRKIVQHPEKIRIMHYDSDVFQQAADEAARDRLERKCDEHTRRLNEDWSILNSQIVVAETF